MAEKSLRKTRKGTVVSKSGNKSIVVLVETRRQHPLYKKVVTYPKKFHVHDEENVAVVGDKVEIIECRPVSRLTRWRLNKVDQQI